jgi:hypothetical protein
LALLLIISCVLYMNRRGRGSGDVIFAAATGEAKPVESSLEANETAMAGEWGETLVINS